MSGVAWSGWLSLHNPSSGQQDSVRRDFIVPDQNSILTFHLTSPQPISPLSGCIKVQGPREDENRVAQSDAQGASGQPPAGGQQSVAQYDSITGDPWTCTVTQLNQRPSTDTVILTFLQDGTIQWHSVGEQNLTWAWLGQTRWVLQGSTVSWDPETDYTFGGVINDENTSIVGTWNYKSGSETASGPLTCQR